MNRRTLLLLSGAQIALEARASESASTSARLRELALKTKATDLGPNVSALTSHPWGVVVDVSRADVGALTIACMADGSTSLYFSLGGGVLGAGRDPAVRAAARRLLEEAAEHVPSMKVPSSTVMPPPGSVAFFVLAAGGPYYATEPERSLQEGSGKLSSLYRQSQAVFRAVREAESSGTLK